MSKDKLNWSDLRKKYFYLDGERKTKLEKWFADLEDKNRIFRAKLSRCQSVEDVLLSSVFHSSIRYFFEQERLVDEKFPWQAWALIFALLARVKSKEETKPFFKQLGSSKEYTDNPILSELRFRQLMKCQDIEELYRGLIRAIMLLGKKVNIISLSEKILLWVEEHQNSTFSLQLENRFKYQSIKEYYS